MIYSNDEMDIPNQKSFITQNNSLILKPEKKSIVFKLEDVIPPQSHDNEPIPLPENSNFTKVTDNILNTLKKFNPKYKNPVVVATWQTYFNSKECQAILSDMFWYCLTKMNKIPDMSSYKKSLLNRVASNYISIFVNVPKEHKEIFFESFYNSIAQGVFCCMFFSYPKSRYRLNTEEFKNEIYEMVSKKISGLNIQNEGFKHWILELGDGNRLKRQSKSQESTLKALPDLRSNSHTRRTLQKIRYSPLVSHYLKSKRYEAINAVPEWSMKYTVRDLQKEREVDKKFSFFKKLAIDTERKAREREKEIVEIGRKIDEEIKEGGREYRRFVNRLNRRTKEIIKKEVASEYANKIISINKMMNEKKPEYIDLFN